MSEKEKLSNEISNLTNAEVKMLRRFLKTIYLLQPINRYTHREWCNIRTFAVLEQFR